MVQKPLVTYRSLVTSNLPIIVKTLENLKYSSDVCYTTAFFLMFDTSGEEIAAEDTAS
jgi:hypothetical protein